MGQLATIGCTLGMMFYFQSLPWIIPGDFRERLRMSDLVVSGKVEETSAARLQGVDQHLLRSNVARLRVDRIFQGQTTGTIEFTWFTPQFEAGIYSGPPLAHFQPNRRYLVFLKRAASGWVVALPLYQIEMELAPVPPANSLRDLSGTLPAQRNTALAEELETAALLAQPAQPGTTGEAATYFPAVFDLLGGCARPFYRRFSSSPNPQLREEALRWLSFVHSKGLTCSQFAVPVLH